MHTDVTDMLHSGTISLYTLYKNILKKYDTVTRILSVNWKKNAEGKPLNEMVKDLTSFLQIGNKIL